MAPVEVVQKAFRFEQTDVVPFHIKLAETVAGRVDEHYGSRSWRDKLPPYLCCGFIEGLIRSLDDGTECDAFGSIIQPGNIARVVKPVLAEPSLARYQWPGPELFVEEIEVRTCLAQKMTESYRIFGLGNGLFERSWYMRGMENVLMDMIDHPAFVDELMDGIVEIQLMVMDMLVAKVPMEAYYGGDDWCGQRGPIMGVGPWRRFIKPRLAKIIDRCHQHNLPYICHSCGNLIPLIDDLMEIGMDGLESLQPEAMDIYALKQRTRGKMILIGGMGVQSTMPHGTQEQVRAETDRLIREMGRGGGYVLAPAKAVMDDVPTDNVVAFVETACRQLR